jgi:hypothetical protein
MSCPCSLNTLRFFVRSVARIDLEASSQRTTLRNSNAVRGFATYQPHRLQRSARRNTPTGTSDQKPRAENWVPFGNAPSTSEQLEQPNRWPVKANRRAASEEADSYNTTNTKHEPEISLQGGGLLDGFDGDPNHLHQPVYDVSFSTSSPPKLESAFEELTLESLDAIAAESNERPKPMIRRMQKPKAQAEGFSIHYSAPPSAVKPKPQSQPIKEKPISEESYTPRQREQWQIQKAALKEKFGSEGWNPRKRLSPDALEGIRALHTQFPQVYSTSTLAEKFAVSPEAIRRILKSKWTPKEAEEESRKERWWKRGEKVWGRMAELGMKPPKQWREAGVGKVESGAPVWDRKKTKNKKGGIAVKTGWAKTYSAAPSESSSLGERIM